MAAKGEAPDVYENRERIIDMAPHSEDVEMATVKPLKRALEDPHIQIIAIVTLCPFSW